MDEERSQGHGRRDSRHTFLMFSGMYDTTSYVTLVCITLCYVTLHTPFTFHSIWWKAFSLQKSPKPSSQIGFPFTLVTWLKWPAWSDILPKIHWLSLAQQERRSSQRSRTKCPLAIYFIRMKVIFLSCNRILGKWFSMADDWRKFYKNCT